MHKSFVISILLIFFVTPINAWLIVDPIDHKKLNQNSDICGIVEVLSLKETGMTKDIYGDGVKYREVVLSIKTLSAFKGKMPDSFFISIYRIPTVEELKKDGDSDPSLKNLQLSVSEVNHHYLIDVIQGDTLLVYLKGNSESGYKPTTGASRQSHSIFCMEPSSLIRSKSILKQANRN